MKNKFLKLDNPCSENWDKMKPNDQGSFCDLCSKNVIDFTNLSQDEISKTMKKSGNNLCARLTKSQLNTPIWHIENSFEFTIPKSNIAAGFLIATSLTIGHAVHAENLMLNNEVTQSSNSILKTKKELGNSKISETRLVEYTTFKGKVTSHDMEILIENAKITFVSSQKLISTFSSKDGTFTLEIPTDLIDNDNVIRVSYNEIKNESESSKFYGYETKDFILTKNELSSDYIFKALPELIYVGGIGSYVEKRDPIVLSNGLEIKYSEFVKAQLGKKSSCNLEGKGYLYFEPKFAVAIYGSKAKDGLYMLVNIREK